MADEDEAPQNGALPAQGERQTLSTPPPKPKGRRGRTNTSPQTPVARSTTPSPPDDPEATAAGSPSASALKAPRAPSFALQTSASDEIDVELDLSPEALHAEPQPPSSGPAARPPAPSRSGPPVRPRPARPISMAPPRPAPRPRAPSEPPRPAAEPARPASEPAHPASEPAHPASEPARSSADTAKAASKPLQPTGEVPRPSSDQAKAVVDSAAAATSGAPSPSLELAKPAKPPRIDPPSPTASAPPPAPEVFEPPPDSEPPPLSEPPPIPALEGAPAPSSASAAESAPGSAAAELAGASRRGRTITIPDDEVPSQQRKQGGSARSAISAMRIISIGEDTDDDIPLEVVTEEPASDELKGPRGKLDSAEELSDEDVAPAWDEPAQNSDGAQARATSDRPSAGKPPPPPRRTSLPARERQPTLSGIDSEPKRRPWWEEMFSEDYTRAGMHLEDKQIVHEVNFIEQSLGVAPGGIVLDLGCGAGHHAVELARRGYGVVGYDLSLYQLALAADVAQEKKQKVNFLQGDMREMAFEEMFDGVYCWNTTFGYFEEEKNVLVAQHIFRALKPGGALLLDVANRDFAAVQQPSQVWYEGDACVCMDDMSVDFITSRLRVKRTIIFDDGRSRECIYSIRLYALHELGKILHDVGFRIAEASGHPATPGVYLGTCSPRLIMLAQKP